VRYHDPYVPFFDPEDADVPAGRVVGWNDGVDRRAKRRGPSDGTVRLVETRVNGRRRADPLTSVELDDDLLRGCDCVIVATAHRDIDYERVARLSRIVVDTRNVVPAGQLAKVVHL
jgi:hypothetical protein